MAEPIIRTPRTSRPESRNVDVFGLTDVGRRRTRNDDHFLIASLHKLLRVHQTSLPENEYPEIMSESRGWLFLVADGVGGRPDGDEASGTVVRTVAEYVTHFTDLYRRLDPARETAFLQELQKSVQLGHQILKERAEHLGGPGQATTLTMVAALWPRAYLVQVGDSRCYRWREGKLERMSKDQTMAQALLDAGALTPDQAESSPLNNMLVSALGGKEATLMTASAELLWEDVMLLCTDGLTKHVSEDEIRDILGSMESAEDGAHTLVDRALEGGGTDNVTVVVARLRKNS